MAMHQYAGEHGGRLPPAVVYGKDGRPLHSWRVLLLPYVADKELYDEFRLDEPWDSEHNLALLPRMPSSYAPPWGKRSRMPAYHTVCHAFVGKGTPFESNEELQVPDWQSQTLLLVEAGPPVPWTKPEDIPYDPNRPLPPLNTLFSDGFRAISLDFRQQFIKNETSEGALRALITRDDARISTLDENGVFQAHTTSSTRGQRAP
jgi:hypothetical protein